MSRNIILTREELINNFMKKFLLAFEDFEQRFLMEIYKIKSMQEFNDFNLKIFETVPVDRVCNIVSRTEEYTERPSKSMFIVHFLIDWSASLIRKTLRTFSKNFLLPVSTAIIHSHVSGMRNYAN